MEADQILPHISGVNLGHWGNSWSMFFSPFNPFLLPYLGILIVAISTGASCLLATSLFLLLFAAMQVYRVHLASSQFMTIFGGFLGSFLFILSLTAIGNLETYVFGKGFQTKLFPEVLISILVAVFASGLVHRVCITTCFLFSLVALYYMNKLSTKEYAALQPPVVNPIPEKKKKK